MRTTLLALLDSIDVRFGDVHAVRDVYLDVPGRALRPRPHRRVRLRQVHDRPRRLGLTPLDRRNLTFDGADVARCAGRDMKAFRRAVQLVFQDGDGALDPRMRVGGFGRRGASPSTTLRAAGPCAQRPRRRAAGRGRARSVLRGPLSAPALRRAAPARRDRPGARRRAAAAGPRRADQRPRRHRPGPDPRLSSACATERRLAYILISHNLAVVDQLCDACLVLKDGAVVESGPTATVLDRPGAPLHPGAPRRPCPRSRSVAVHDL